MVVDARFNGRPLRVIFDTGAGYILTPEAAAELGLDVEGAGQSGGAGEQRVDTGVTQVADMQIGDVHIRDHEYAVISLADSPNVFGSAQIDGVVGFEVLERFVTRIDYEERELSFMVPELFSYDGNGVAIPVQPACAGTVTIAHAAFGERRFSPVCGNSAAAASADRAAAVQPACAGNSRSVSRPRSTATVQPACAGNRTMQSYCRRTAPVQPACAGTDFVRDINALLTRFSPRVRGTENAADHAHGCARFSPACAGNSCHDLPRGIILEVQPRVCGNSTAVPA
ncbi:retropepsin-like aspartic protease [Hankyongella ginsenosidimutans]|uniref:retropepsin-like aspartic protease n=1 Tax=Hankyongella ginsenosidimutans TaxID=1763828 RepID=UPI0024832E89|nr:retropepsin-like aspartic protease [Hankyongella ginsenosidimutans]